MLQGENDADSDERAKSDLYNQKMERLITYIHINQALADFRATLQEQLADKDASVKVDPSVLAKFGYMHLGTCLLLLLEYGRTLTPKQRYFKRRCTTSFGKNNSLVTCTGGDQINLGSKYQSERLLLGLGWSCVVNTISTYNINYINAVTIDIEQSGFWGDSQGASDSLGQQWTRTYLEMNTRILTGM
jgi:hypothetical protein